METALVKGALEVIECEQQRPSGFLFWVPEPLPRGAGSSLQLLDIMSCTNWYTFLDGTLAILMKTENVFSLEFSSPTPGNLTHIKTIAYIHTGICTRLFTVQVALCIEKIV